MTLNEIMNAITNIKCNFNGFDENNNKVDIQQIELPKQNIVQNTYQNFNNNNVAHYNAAVLQNGSGYNPNYVTHQYVDSNMVDAYSELVNSFTDDQERFNFALKVMGDMGYNTQMITNMFYNQEQFETGKYDKAMTEEERLEHDKKMHSQGKQKYERLIDYMDKYHGSTLGVNFRESIKQANEFRDSGKRFDFYPDTFKITGMEDTPFEKMEKNYDKAKSNMTELSNADIFKQVMTQPVGMDTTPLTPEQIKACDEYTAKKNQELRQNNQPQQVVYPQQQPQVYYPQQQVMTPQSYYNQLNQIMDFNVQQPMIPQYNNVQFSNGYQSYGAPSIIQPQYDNMYQQKIITSPQSYYHQYNQLFQDGYCDIPMTQPQLFTVENVRKNREAEMSMKCSARYDNSEEIVEPTPLNKPPTEEELERMRNVILTQPSKNNMTLYPQQQNIGLGIGVEPHHNQDIKLNAFMNMKSDPTNPYQDGEDWRTPDESISDVELKSYLPVNQDVEEDDDDYSMYLDDINVIGNIVGQVSEIVNDSFKKKVILEDGQEATFYDISNGGDYGDLMHAHERIIGNFIHTHCNTDGKTFGSYLGESERDRYMNAFLNDYELSERMKIGDINYLERLLLSMEKFDTSPEPRREVDMEDILYNYNNAKELFFLKHKCIEDSNIFDDERMTYVVAANVMLKLTQDPEFSNEYDCHIHLKYKTSKDLEAALGKKVNIFKKTLRSISSKTGGNKNLISNTYMNNAQPVVQHQQMMPQMMNIQQPVFENIFSQRPAQPQYSFQDTSVDVKGIYDNMDAFDKIVPSGPKYMIPYGFMPHTIYNTQNPIDYENKDNMIAIRMGMSHDNIKWETDEYLNFTIPVQKKPQRNFSLDEIIGDICNIGKDVPMVTQTEMVIPKYHISQLEQDVLGGALPPINPYGFYTMNQMKAIQNEWNKQYDIFNHLYGGNLDKGHYYKTFKGDSGLRICNVGNENVQKILTPEEEEALRKSYEPVLQFSYETTITKPDGSKETVIKNNKDSRYKSRYNNNMVITREQYIRENAEMFRPGGHKDRINNYINSRRDAIAQFHNNQYNSLTPEQRLQQFCDSVNDKVFDFEREELKRKKMQGFRK